MVGQQVVKGHNPKKAHLHRLRDVCVQYERNPPMGFRDILQKRKCRQTDSKGDKNMCSHVQGNAQTQTFLGRK